MTGFQYESTLSQRCMQTHQCDDLKRIEEKLDLILQRLNSYNAVKDFGIGVLANLVGNRIDGK